jgi:hypothetical protein
MTYSLIPSKRRGRNHMVFGYTISAYRPFSCQPKSHSWRVVLDTTLCNEVCQWFAASLWFSPCTPVSSSNKTDCHDTTEILLKVALNTINTQSNPSWSIIFLNKYKYLLQRTSQNCTVTIRESHLRDILIGF